MTSEDKGHYGKKNPPDFKANPELVKEIKGLAKEKGIPCAAAFKIAKTQNIEPRVVGATIDSLEITITNCQLGLFGYANGKGFTTNPNEVIAEDLKDAIMESLVDGKLTCKSAWDIAARLNLGKMKVSTACEVLKIKLTSCQLGAF